MSAYPTSNLTIECGLNERGILTAGQRVVMVRHISVQVALFSVLMLILFLLSGDTLLISIVDSVLLGAILSTLAGGFINILLVVDLIRGRVVKTTGDCISYSIRMGGGVGRTRSVRGGVLIGGVDLRGVALFGLQPPFSEGIRYTAYYLPLSKFIVSYVKEDPIGKRPHTPSPSPTHVRRGT